MTNMISVRESDQLVLVEDTAKIKKHSNATVKVFVDGYMVETNEIDLIVKSFLQQLNGEHTRKSYANSIREFMNFAFGERKIVFSDLIIDPIFAIMYQDYWYKKIENGIIKTATYNQKIKGINLFYQYLVNISTSNMDGTKYFEKNPFDVVKQKAENDSEGAEPLTSDEVILMYNNPYGHNEHVKERNKLMLDLAISTGIRNYAIIMTKMSDIYAEDKNYVLCVTDKEGKVFRKTINRLYHQIMKWYEADLKLRGNDDNETIFNLHPVSASRIIKEWAESVGIWKKITFHSLRTTTAVQLYHATENKHIVQTELGHNHLETTDVYLKKEKKISDLGETIMPTIFGKEKEFETFLNGKSIDELKGMLMSLDAKTKIQLMNK